MSRCCLPVLTALAVCLLSGCGPTKGQVESEVKKMLESQLKITVSSLSLQETGPKAYSGTATSDRGDTYELAVKVEGDTIHLKAIPDRAGVEKEFRKMIESQGKGLTIASFSGLKRDDEMCYTGKATLNNGQVMTLSTSWQGEQYMYEVKPQ
jgi:hypothetical protein